MPYGKIEDGDGGPGIGGGVGPTRTGALHATFLRAGGGYRHCPRQGVRVRGRGGRSGDDDPGVMFAHFSDPEGNRVGTGFGAHT